MSEFEVIGEIGAVELIARGFGIRDIARLNRQYGNGKWRKLKGLRPFTLKNRPSPNKASLVRGTWNYQRIPKAVCGIMA